MDRRTFLRKAGLAAVMPLWLRESAKRKMRGASATSTDSDPADVSAANGLGGTAAVMRAGFRRRRPSDADWPSQAAWKRLNDAVDGNLIPVEFPIAACVKDVDSAACKELIGKLKNPYYIGDQPGVTQTLGWVDAWVTKPSVYAVAARNAQHVAAAVNFARENNLRLVVKGGGHSYQGTSNAPDSLLIWTRHMHDITMHETFVPQGCTGKAAARGDVWLRNDLDASV